MIPNSAAKILTAKELRAIMPRLPGWKLVRNKLVRTFEFKNFVQSMKFVNSLVASFEKANHHPDVKIAYRDVTFALTTHDSGGKVTNRDVRAAKTISAEYPGDQPTVITIKSSPQITSAPTSPAWPAERETPC